MHSKYRGVSWNNKNKAWQARIRHGGEILSLGYFDDDDKAAKAFDIVALRIHKNLARTNFSSSSYDGQLVQRKNLKDVIRMAKALSRKRRKGSDGDREKQHEEEALKVCRFADDEENEESAGSSKDGEEAEGAATQPEDFSRVLLHAAEMSSLREKVDDLEKKCRKVEDLERKYNKLLEQMAQNRDTAKRPAPGISPTVVAMQYSCPLPNVSRADGFEHTGKPGSSSLGEVSPLTELSHCRGLVTQMVGGARTCRTRERDI